MNRILNILKILLFMLLIALNCIYIRGFGLLSYIYLFYLLLLLTFGLLMFKDLIKKDKINDNKVYNIILVFLELTMIFIFVRAIFDQRFLYNSNYYTSLIMGYNNIFIDNVKLINIFYIIQSSWYLNIMLLLILIYRKINIEKRESKYSMISLTCFYISICTIIPTILYISATLDNVLWFLILNIILVVTEIYRLIHDNHIKREWIIYVSFFFNLAAFIAIFINMFY